MFNIKRQSYQLSLEKTKQFLEQNDLENGVESLKKTIELSNELILNCTVYEVKKIIVEENQKLNSLLKTINEKKINPFFKETLKKENDFSSEKKSNYFQTNPPKITLKDVAGLEEVKEEIKINVIAPLKDPETYFKYKDEVGCQILMYGPPGCGKSFVAEAIAGELKCAYAIINVHDILDKYVGEAPKKIVQIFKDASEFDNCLIFFDELDALFSSRESDDSTHTKDILTSFLTCLSGFNTDRKDKRVRIVIGATNRPWILDSALLRGKRFDTHIYVGLPNQKAREFLINKKFKNRMNILDNTNITINELVTLLGGYSGADIDVILDKSINKALSRAIKNKELKIDKEEPITYEDVSGVLKEYRNCINQEMLKAFETFKAGVI